MKTVLLIVVVVVTPFSFAGNELWVYGSDIVKGGYELIGLDVIQEVESLKVGSTRAEVLKLFKPAGGCSPAEARLVYRRDAKIQLDVKFECARDGDGRVIKTAQDKVLSISRPYLSSTFPQD